MSQLTQQQCVACSRDSAKIENQQLAELRQNIPDWTVRERDHVMQLERAFKFKNFTYAFSFMTAVAIEAEKMNHHPWWSNVYNTVVIHLQTHDAGNKVTEKDESLSAIIDEIYAKYND